GVAGARGAWRGGLAVTEGAARQLPLASDCAALVVSTEVLCCLNEGYADGLRSCARGLKPGPAARLLVSERSWEGGLVTRLLYSGVASLIEMKDSRDLRDGLAAQPLRTRTFTEEELLEQFRKAGLTVVERKGTPLLSLWFGSMRGRAAGGADGGRHLPELQARLADLGEGGLARRAHTLVAHKAAA